MKKIIIILGFFLTLTFIWMFSTLQNTVEQPSSSTTNIELNNPIPPTISQNETLPIKEVNVVSTPATSTKDSSIPISITSSEETEKKNKLSQYQNFIQQNPMEAYELLMKETVQQLSERWIGILDNRDAVSLDERSLLAQALISKLRKSSDDAFYQEIENVLTSTSSEKHKSMLIHLLKDIATPDSLNVLLNYTPSISQRDVKTNMIRAIYDIGDNRWGNRFHTELSPLLEESWLELNHDQYLFKAITESIAKIGSPTGIQLLIENLNASTLSQEQKYITEFAMSSVRNQRSIDYLQKNMRGNYDIGDRAIIASGTALASIGRLSSTKALLNWAKSAPVESTDYVKTWFNMVMRDPASIALLQKELPELQFKTSSIKQVISSLVEN